MAGSVTKQIRPLANWGSRGTFHGTWWGQLAGAQVQKPGDRDAGIRGVGASLSHCTKG